MTTNHYPKLDKALIRPGRVDVIKYFGLASEKQTMLMFRRFFPEESEELARQFASQIPPNTRSMAELQGFLLANSSDSSQPLKNVHSFLTRSENQDSSSDSDCPNNKVMDTK